MDLLDDLLNTFENQFKTTQTAIIKHEGGGFSTCAVADLDATFGELDQVETRSIEVDGVAKEIPVFSQKVTQADRDAQEARSKKYKIEAKKGGSITMPKKWVDAGLKETDFADPVNFALPVHDKTHVQNALSRWTNMKSGYSDDEQAIIEKRIRTAAKREGVDAASLDDDADSKGAGDGKVDKSGQLTIGDDVFSQVEHKDRLGRSTFEFILGDAGDDGVEAGFVYRGTVAKLRCPADTDEGEMRRLLSVLSQHKSAGDDVEPKKKGDPVAKQKGNDFLDNLGDRMESLGCSALSSVWYSFASSVMDEWDGDLEDLDQGTFDSYVAALAKALSRVWETFANYDTELAQLGVDLRVMRRAFKGQYSKNEKAGAALSRARRTQLEQAREIINGVLDEEKDDKKNAGDKAPATDPLTKGIDNADVKGIINQLRSELDGVKEATGAELKEAQESRQELERKLQEATAALQEKDALLEKLGKEPLPPPEVVSDPAGANADGQEKTVIPVQNTIYEMVGKQKTARPY